MNFYGVVSYFPEHELQRHLQSLQDNELKYIGIFHNQDEGKPNHYHIIVSSDESISYKSLKQIFNTYSNVFVKPVRKLCKALDYLTHKGISNKHHYDKSEIFSNDFNYWDNMYLSDYDSEDDLIDDLLSYDFSVISMARKYGRDFIKNMNSYLQFRANALQEVQDKRSADVYLANLDKQYAEIRRFNTDREKIAELFPDITDDVIGSYSLKDYEDIKRYINRFKRDKNYNIVKVYYLRHLPHMERESLESLIYKRQRSGIFYEFHDDDPAQFGLTQLLNLPNIVPSQRRNIYLPDTII